MASATISDSEDFIRSRCAECIESGLPLAPVFRTILNALLSVTALSVGADEIRSAKVADGNRFTVKLALRVLSEKYSQEVLMLVLSLDNGPSNAH